MWKEQFKILETVVFVVDLTKVFDSIYWREMKQILLL